MKGTWDMATFPFTLRTDIHDLQVITFVIEFVHRHLPNLSKWETGVVPRFHPTDEVTGEFCETGTNEESNDFVEVIIVFQNDENRFVRVEK